MVNSHGAIRVTVYRKDITWGKAVLCKSAFKGGGGGALYSYFRTNLTTGKTRRSVILTLLTINANSKVGGN